MAVFLSITWQKIIAMVNRNEDENAFVQTVKKWLSSLEITYEAQVFTYYAHIRTARWNLVLDFLHVPYRKPKLDAIIFSLDHFLFHPEALRSRILSLFGKTNTLFARNCRASRIGKEDAQAFFNANHLSGYANSKFKYGLFHDDELVAAITFAQGRNLKTNHGIIRSYEWVGFCQAAGLTITGGLSKLVKDFVRDKNPGHIATYVDLDWAEGKAFEKLGFQPTAKLPPLSFVIDWETGKRVYPSRVNRKKGSADLNSFPYVNSGYQKFEQFYSNK